MALVCDFATISLTVQSITEGLPGGCAQNSGHPILQCTPLLSNVCTAVYHLVLLPSPYLECTACVRLTALLAVPPPSERPC